MSYSVEFGYTVLPFALLFMSETLQKKQASDLVMTLILMFMIFSAGSRGPILFIGVFIVLYILTELRGKRHKILIVGGITIVTTLLYNYYTTLLMLLQSILFEIGISSRFISMVLDGSISDDTGRSNIWNAAVQMIRDNPWGYGAMGTRYKLSRIIIAGYPHSVVLEILVDFGVIIGGIILAVLFIGALKVLFFNSSREMRILFLVYFASACSLFLSMTYWSVPTFWICIALAVNSRLCNERLSVWKTRINLN